MRILSICLMAFISYTATSQTKDTFTDPRDGREYEIQLIDSTWWFADNLMYETAGSHCPNVSTKDCSQANFYPFTELDDVCPSGWHVSTLKEWQAFVEMRQIATGVDSLTKDFFRKELVMEGYVALSDSSLNLTMFSDDAPLNLKGIGWVEGKRKARIKNLTIWASHPTADYDKKYHIHISSNSYVGHRHDHHIVDKPRRVRKFAVRCVKD